MKTSSWKIQLSAAILFTITSMSACNESPSTHPGEQATQYIPLNAEQAEVEPELVDSLSTAADTTETVTQP